MQEIYITHFKRILKTLTEYLRTKTKTFMFDIIFFNFSSKLRHALMLLDTSAADSGQMDL